MIILIIPNKRILLLGDIEQKDLILLKMSRKASLRKCQTEISGWVDINYWKVESSFYLVKAKTLEKEKYDDSEELTEDQCG